MSTKIDWDTTNKIIKIKSGITELNVQSDLYSDAKKDWLLSNHLSKFEFPIRVVGGDNLSQGKIITPKYFLKAPWVIKPYEGSHELIIEGDLFSDESPPSGMTIPTSGTYTALISFNRSFESITTTISTVEIVPSGVVGTSDGTMDASFFI